jgi:ADP-heptose:LPS heptosyltransferase
VRILLVRLRLIGDVVFTTPLIRALRRLHPDAHLAYLVEPSAAPILHRNPHLDDLIVAPRRTGAHRLIDDLALAARLRRERFDIAIDLHGGPRAAGSPEPAARACASATPCHGGHGSTRTAFVESPDLFPRHSVVNQWDLLAPLGIDVCTPERDPVEMAVDPAIADRVTRRLEAAGIRGDDPLVVVHVSAGNEFRRWPEASFSSMIASVAQADPRRRIIVVSGPSDTEAAGE